MKTILHLCADIGSDSKVYADNGYKVVLVGSDIGVENYSPTEPIYGVIANPVCTEFSIACRGFRKENDYKKGMFLVNHCLRIIKECNPTFWVLENPATGHLKDFLGKPQFVYQPWQYGSPWTKKTGLWGKFNIPLAKYKKWEDVEKNSDLYIRPNRAKPSLISLHKSAVELIPEFSVFKNKIKRDSDLRSLCSQKFAQAFFEVNK